MIRLFAAIALVAGLLLGAPAHAQPAPAPAAERGLFRVERSSTLVAILGIAGLVLVLLAKATKGRELFVRRIPGVDAIEDAIGRATELGRPVLYIPGIEEMQDIETLASMLILSSVAEKTARYQTPMIVANRIPFVMTVADEVVREACVRAGRPEAYRPDDVRFVSAEQFAFTAGANGIMLRERPATNLLLGKFYAESLILAETGFQAGALQIAGTAEITQLPFFIAACDYTLIGEELFAASAYLSKDARLLSTLKAADYAKIAIIGLVVIGIVAQTLGWHGLGSFMQGR